MAEREAVVVYRGADGKMYVDFVTSFRLDAEEWVALVRKINDQLFDKLLNGARTM